MESKEQVQRIKEILPDCTEREIYKALKHCKMDANDAIQRLLSQVETEKSREGVPMEWKEQVECIKEMVPLFTEEDREGVPMEWKEQVESVKEMMPCFTEEMIYRMLEQRNNDSDLTMPRLLSQEFEEQCKFSLMIQSDSSSDYASSSVQETPCNSGSPFLSPPSNAKSSVASQLHSVSLDKGKEVARHTEDDAAATSRSNVQALCAKGPWSYHALQAGSDPMALGIKVASSSRNDSGNSVALGSFDFLEYELFPPPTEQCGISFTLNDLVGNADQQSELRCLLRSPFLDTSSVPSRSSTAGSQHPQTSMSESGPSEATPNNSATSPIQPFGDPQDQVLDAPFGCSRYDPIQHPERTSESGLSEATPSNLLRCSIQSTQKNSPDLPSLQFHHVDAHSVSNTQPFTSSASIRQSPEILFLGNNMSAGHGFTRPYIELSSYEPQWPLQQHGSMDGGDNMHQNFRYDMPSAQQEVHEGGGSSWANADGSNWGSHRGEGSTPHGSLTISPAPSDISRTSHDFALQAQAQQQLRNENHPAEMNCNYAAWNHQTDSGAMSALPKLQLGSFPGWAPLPAKANSLRGEGSSPQYAHRRYLSRQLPETRVMKPSVAKPV